MKFRSFSRRCRRLVLCGAGVGAVLGIAKLSILCTNSFLDSSLDFLTFGIYKSILCKSSRNEEELPKGAYVNSKLRESEFKLSAPRHNARRVHSNQLFSNSPGEDRHVMGFDSTRDLSVFAIIDGHGGWQCADVLKHNILSHTIAKVAPEHVETLRVVNPSIPDHFDKDVDSSPKLPLENECTKSEVLSIQEKFSKALYGLDQSLTDRALKDVRLVEKGHFLTEDMKENIMQAISGACAVVAYLKGRDLFIANTGDCRAVLGTRSEGKWVALPLSKDQQCNNPEEVSRLHSGHPGEEKTIITDGRLLGSLMPLRSFGDVSFKWKPKDLSVLQLPVLANYYTPPYLTAKPVVTHHRITEGDKFLVLGTDGLWEKLTNSEVVQLVGNLVDSRPMESRVEQPTENETLWQKLRGRGPRVKDTNAATLLLRHALGGDDDAVYRVMKIKPPLSRMFRDDITITVVFFKD